MIPQLFVEKKSIWVMENITIQTDRLAKQADFCIGKLSKTVILEQ
jgi:hypothetical protein